MRTMTGMAWAVAMVALAACGGDGGDVTGPPDSKELACVNPTAAGAAVTCSMTLPANASVKLTISGTQSCEADGDTFVITAPAADTLTIDGCNDLVGKELDLGTLSAGTKISAELKPGVLISGSPGVAAVRVDGKYPQWTVNLEDAVAAFPGEPDDYDDLVVTVAVTPAQ